MNKVAELYMRLNLRGLRWSPEAEKALLLRLWGRVIDKRARPEGPLVRQPRRRKKRRICKIPNPQASARKRNERQKMTSGKAATLVRA